MQDVSVTVGGTVCMKPTATDSALSCKAPEQPREVDNKGNALVMVKTIQSITFYPGFTFVVVF